MNITQLHRILESHDISIDEWGKGKAKSLENLLHEINSGESILASVEGKIYRAAIGSVVRVYRLYNGGLCVLTEGKQVFADGTVHRRDLPFSVGEKVFPGESSLEAAQRAFKEELGIDEKIEFNRHSEYVQGPVPSTSYPGILTTYFVDVWSVFMPSHLFRKEGYVEVQPDKTSYFFWIPYKNKKIVK
ncbi:MAG: NUDIX hydrolase [Candidatus Paceibacterota bacterium]